MNRPLRLRHRMAALATVALMAGGVAAVAPGSGADAAPSRGLAAAPTSAVAQQPHRPRHRQRLAITVLSSRADLVSAGSALVAIRLPRRADARRVKVLRGDHNVTGQFAYRRDGQFEGLVRGLKPGRTTLKAILRGGQAARITLTDHPQGGPLLSGPQIHPWVCQKGAADRQCNQAPTLTYEYMSTNPATSGFQPYDPKSPPRDVARTTTDQGKTVPFIVRVETGYQDRDQYQITALYQPGKKWSGVAPQPQFNHKLLITHGASCGDDRTTGTAPSTSGSAATNDALGRGFITMSTALDNSGHNCTLAVQAESLLMAKEHVVKAYGTLRYTIGTGCSGGSLAEQWISNAYPGIYQGILPTCSFPDAYSTATQFLDYHLLLAYFTNPSAQAVPFLPSQMGDVLGGPDGLANAKVSEQAQFHVAVPTDACAGTTAAQRYNAKSNPGGVRCTIADAAVNMFGPEERRFWTAAEKRAGHGFVRLPVDNVGVQYGLAAFRAGQITAAQFVDLNAKAGGVDIDANRTAARTDNGGSASLARAYRTGLINEANNLDRTAIIDCRGTNPGIFHDTYRAFAIRARLDREHGSHANQVIWEGPVPLTADKDCEINSLHAMDTWLHRVEKDHSATSLPKKLVRDKPTGLGDACYDGNGTKVSDSLCPAAVVSIEATPRMVAGDPITTDANKCQLQPLNRRAYGVGALTDAEWASLQRTFPTGVCDFSKRGVDQRPTIPWLTYQDAKGHVVYGGKPLGKPPVSHRFRVHR